MVSYLIFITENILPILLTIFIAVVIFLIKEFIVTLVFIPLKNYKYQVVKLKGDLEYYANYISNPILLTDFNTYPPEDKAYVREISSTLRKDGVELEAIWSEISFKNSLRFFNIKILNDEDIITVRSGMIGLSNSLIEDIEGLNYTIRGNYESKEKIKKILQF